MGELRAYAVDLERLRALLGGGPDARDEVVARVRPLLAPTPPPAPLGPVFTRVPGARVVRDDEPARTDLDRLLAGEPVPVERVPATWRLVEALAASLAVASTRVRAPRPHGLGQLVALPPSGDVHGGVRSRAATASCGVPTTWLRTLPEGVVDVALFWSRTVGAGP